MMTHFPPIDNRRGLKAGFTGRGVGGGGVGAIVGGGVGGKVGGGGAGPEPFIFISAQL